MLLKFTAGAVGLAALVTTAGLIWGDTNSQAWDCTPSVPSQTVVIHRRTRTPTPRATSTSVPATHTPQVTVTADASATMPPTAPPIWPPNTGSSGEHGCIDENGVVHDDEED